MILARRLTLADRKDRELRLEPFEARLRTLRRQAKSAHADLLALTEERVNAYTERRELRGHIGLWTEDRRINPPPEAEPPHLQELRLELASVERRITELDEAIEAAEAAWQPQGALIFSCEQWLEQHADRIAAGG
ncbi:MULTISPECIES: hypothetical protein [unclassified Thiocapsa]|uniref:hypothetical protein n=1 Tax=unclassified Thiocapsa TaxID=2641286 RepID=UPI0035B05647